jgi:hypothetical protein
MKDRKKSATKMVTSEMTTALVVDSPTPLAPPVVVKPQAQLICSRRGGAQEEVSVRGLVSVFVEGEGQAVG